MNSQVITILGRPASKKNSKQIGRNRYTGKTFVTSSKAHAKFHKTAEKEMLQYKRYHFTGRLFVSYLFYQKGKMEQDNDNAMGTINDFLQDCGFFISDKQIKDFGGSIVENSADWKTVVTIMPLEEKDQKLFSKRMT